MENIYRNHYCGEITKENVGQEIKIAGWINSIRNLGSLAFLTIRDETGIVQVISEDIEKIKECNGISEERIKKIPLPIVKKVKLVGDNLEFTTTMPRIKLDIPKRQKSMGFINIGTILLLIAVVVCFILGNR